MLPNNLFKHLNSDSDILPNNNKEVLFNDSLEAPCKINSSEMPELG